MSGLSGSWAQEISMHRPWDRNPSISEHNRREGRGTRPTYAPAAAVDLLGLLEQINDEREGRCCARTLVRHPTDSGPNTKQESGHRLGTP